VNRVNFCQLRLRSGMDAELSCRIDLSRELQESEAIYGDLKCEKWAVSDLETFPNPYTDSGILHGSPKQNVNKVCTSMDIETPECVLAARLNEKGMVADGGGAPPYFVAGNRSLFLFSAACPG
jgi:hypothetical protein